jgi:spore maturation protein CgeB
MAKRNTIVVNDRVLSGHVLVKELKKSGVHIVTDIWEPTSELLSECLAYMIWFYDGLRSPVKVWRLSQRLRAHGVPLLAWNQDAPHYLNRAAWRLDLLDKARLLDIYLTHTLADQKRQFAKTQVYFPNAADISKYYLADSETEAFSRMRDQASYKYDVTFFGAMDGSRYKEMRNRQMFFRELADRLTQIKLRYRFVEASSLSIREQVELIQTSKINLNYGASCEFGASFSSGLPERCFGIPAAGGFLLCDKRTHAKDHFVVTQNWAEFEGLDDCVFQIKYWLSNFSQSRDIAEAAYHHVTENHTYAARAQLLSQVLTDWHRTRGVAAPTAY